jgi:hypothetical protein
VRALDGSGYRGREGVEQFKLGTSENWEELQSLPEEFRDLGDSVLVLGRLRGRGKASGAPVDEQQAVVLDFRGPRVWRSRVYLDHARGLRVAGLSEWTRARAAPDTRALKSGADPAGAGGPALRLSARSLPRASVRGRRSRAGRTGTSGWPEPLTRARSTILINSPEPRIPRSAV